MPTGRVIALLAYRRPDDPRLVLEALARCPGIADYRLIAYTQTPVHSPALELLEAIDFCEARARPRVDPVKIDTLAANPDIVLVVEFLRENARRFGPFREGQSRRDCDRSAFWSSRSARASSRRMRRSRKRP